MARLRAACSTHIGLIQHSYGIGAVLHGFAVHSPVDVLGEVEKASSVFALVYHVQNAHDSDRRLTYTFGKNQPRRG